MDYRKEFLVEPGSKMKLDKIDPGYTGRHVSEQKANDDIEKYRAKPTQQQLLMSAEKRHSLLIVLQAQEALALIGYFVSALGKALMGATAWPGVLGGRFLDRFGASFRSPPRDALIASSVSDEYRGRAFGFEGIGDNLGAFLGPLLAILLLLSFHIEIRLSFVCHYPDLCGFQFDGCTEFVSSG